jgi:flagellar basal-body rod modification protein FlgD
MTAAAIGGAATAAPFFGAVQSKAQAASTPPTTGSGSGSGTNSLSAGNLGTTFLSLLVQELKNQDPTQPMDPTAMVGQMISLNQLDQLIGINQTLNPSAATTTTGTGQNGLSLPPAAAKTGGSAAAALDPSLDPTQAGASLAGNQAAIAAALAAGNAASPNAANNATPLNLGNLNALLGGK